MDRRYCWLLGQSSFNINTTSSTMTISICRRVSSTALTFTVQNVRSPSSSWHHHPVDFTTRQYYSIKSHINNDVMMDHYLLWHSSSTSLGSNCGSTSFCHRRISDSSRMLPKAEYTDTDQSQETEISIGDHHGKQHYHQPQQQKQQRRTTLNYARKYRKMKLRKRNEDSISSDMNLDPSQDFDKSNKDDGNSDDDKNKATPPPSPDGYILPNGEFVFGSPHIGNPIRDRYIRSLQKIHYPKTIHGWIKVMKKSWEKYLWTFEGFLLKEKKRDAHGNVIVQEESVGNNVKAEEENESASLRDAATDAASGIAKNVQKNITTLQEEAPRLLRMGQQITGVSSKEELREWVSDQLKLATACLTEFMTGYRKGRDEEIDRMLHAYFNETDGDNTNEMKSASKDDNFVVESESNNEEVSSVVQQNRTSKKRTWGRSERRRLKELSNRASRNHADQVIRTEL